MVVDVVPVEEMKSGRGKRDADTIGSTLARLRLTDPLPPSTGAAGPTLAGAAVVGSATVGFVPTGSITSHRCWIRVGRACSRRIWYVVMVTLHPAAHHSSAGGCGSHAH